MNEDVTETRSAVGRPTRGPSGGVQTLDGAPGRAPGRRPQEGPPLPPVAIAAIALFMASLVLPIVLSGGDVYPSPFASGEEIVGYFRGRSDQVLVASLLQFAASLPLVVFAAVVSVRLGRLGVQAPGPRIGFAGGILAAVSLAMSAGFSWALTRPEILAHDDLIRLLHDLAFVTGGAGFVVPLGLLVAGIAVPGLLARLLPRWHAWAGLVIAAVAMVATLSVALPGLSILLPIARFPAFAWIVSAAFLLPRRRDRRGETTANQGSSR
ncbi:hypothetical protein [Rhodococcus sp. NPDC059234]|uniref:hypothetical protein n=1 Tax=Rhodococcus sp. NPDC059234 TaxID=3346781 RepID=UPI00366EEB71